MAQMSSLLQATSSARAGVDSSGAEGARRCTVAKAAWAKFDYTLTIPSGIVVPGIYGLSQYGISATFQAQDLASGTPTVTIGTNRPYPTRLNGPWIKSGAKP